MRTELSNAKADFASLQKGMYPKRVAVALQRVTAAETALSNALNESDEDHPPKRQKTDGNDELVTQLKETISSQKKVIQKQDRELRLRTKEIQERDATIEYLELKDNGRKERELMYKEKLKQIAKEAADEFVAKLQW